MKNDRLTGFVLAILCLVVLLCPAAGQAEGGESSVWDTAFSGGKGRLEQVSLIPEDTAGLAAGFLSGREILAMMAGSPIRRDEFGMAYYPVPAETAETMFRDAMLLSIGPDGAVLWAGTVPDAAGEQALFILRGQELVILLPSGDRGAPDPDSMVRSALRRVLQPVLERRSYNSIPETEWSPDGRYVFWRSLHYTEDGTPVPPCLMDTRTGEIFLLYEPGMALKEGGGTLGYAEAGHFSADGLYLDMSIPVFSAPDAAGNMAATSALVRYSLGTGDITAVMCPQTGSMRFSEIDENRILFESDPALLVTMNDDGIEAKIMDLPGTNSGIRVFGGTTGPAIAALGYENYAAQITSFALSRLSDGPMNRWVMVPEYEGYDEPWPAVTAEELRELLERSEAFHASNTDPSAENPVRLICLRWLIPVRNTPYMLMAAPGAARTEKGWNGSASISQWQFLLLNTETMEVVKIGYDRVMTLSEQTYISRCTDTAIWGDTMMIGGVALKLNPDADPETGAGSPADPVLAGLDAQEMDPADSLQYFNYQSYFFTDVTPDTMECSIWNKTEGYRVENTISVLPEGFRISIRFECLTSAAVPRAMTEERYKEITGRMQGKQKKKVAICYSKVSPDDLGKKSNAEELLALYPALSGQTLYILRISPEDNRMKELEELLAEAGYTAEDYAEDLQYGQYAMAAEGPVGDRVYYTFTAQETPVRWTKGPTLGLLSLAGYLGSSVYDGYLRADRQPDGAGSLTIQGELEFAYIPYRVTLEGFQTDGDNLTVTYAAVPSGERGRYPAGE